MSLLVYGVSHKTTPVEIRERLAIAPEHLSAALTDLNSSSGVQEALILSTCNRTEIYCDIDPAADRKPLEWLLRQGNMPAATLAPHIYSHTEEFAIKHLFRVAGGLDSMVIGEPQILGQLKDAYQAARQAGTLGKGLDKLLQFSFRVAKAIRTDTNVGVAPVSVAHLAVTLAVQLHASLADKTALLIGAGDTIALAAAHLGERDVGAMIIANRSLENAQALAERHNAEAIALTELPAALARADIVISSTGSRLPIITASGMEYAMKQRRHRPVFMVDLAVPRDIEPQVGAMEDVYLYDIDNLQSVVDANLAARVDAANQADELVSIYAQEYLNHLQSLDGVDTVRALRERAAGQREQLLQKALRRLENGDDPRAVVDQVTRTLMNQMLHAPTTMLRDPEFLADPALVDAARKLFDLDRQHGGEVEDDSQC
ncbi:MAG: glutamyl-tRNA reductase [Gammaproteobacteria bacterium]|nr:glutamyl-tRNA reductase [Gammaproteobacteria bacterium]